MFEALVEGLRVFGYLQISAPRPEMFSLPDAAIRWWTQQYYAKARRGIQGEERVADKESRALVFSSGKNFWGSCTKEYCHGTKNIGQLEVSTHLDSPVGYYAQPQRGSRLAR
jgi:hypothetical protein